MAKIISFGEFRGKQNQETFEKNLQREIEEMERKLNIPEDEPLLVLTDMNVLTIGNHLLDARNELNKVLDILGIEENEECIINDIKST